MQANKNPTQLAEPPPARPEPPTPKSRAYDCTGCRFADPHGLVCGFCLRKIFDDQAGQRRGPPLLAACFGGREIILLRRNCAVLV